MNSLECLAWNFLFTILLPVARIYVGLGLSLVVDQVFLTAFVFVFWVMYSAIQFINFSIYSPIQKMYICRFITLCALTIMVWFQVSQTNHEIAYAIAEILQPFVILYGDPEEPMKVKVPSAAHWLLTCLTLHYSMD